MDGSTAHILYSPLFHNEKRGPCSSKVAPDCLGLIIPGQQGQFNFLSCHVTNQKGAAGPGALHLCACLGWHTGGMMKTDQGSNSQLCHRKLGTWLLGLTTFIYKMDTIPSTM